MIGLIHFSSCASTSRLGYSPLIFEKGGGGVPRFSALPVNLHRCLLVIFLRYRLFAHAYYCPSWLIIRFCAIANS